METYEPVRCEGLLLELSKLNEKIDENYNRGYKLNKERHALFDELDQLGVGDSLKARELEERLLVIREEIFGVLEEQGELFKEKERLEQAISFATSPAGSNEVVDLRVVDEERYDIYLHGQNVVVGDIEYRGYHVSDYLGDVGGYVDEAFRGHGYFYEALCVLGDILHEKGIEDFWITMYENNLPSRKSVLKYGGDLLEGNDLYRGVLLYQCPTERKKRNVRK